MPLNLAHVHWLNGFCKKKKAALQGNYVPHFHKFPLN